MAVKDTGQHSLAAQIDLLGLRTGQRPQLRRAAGGQDPAILDRDRFDHAVLRVHGVDLPAV